jgi:hypothetical protein
LRRTGLVNDPAMAPKRPWFDIPWHAPSDQPVRLGDRELKRRLRSLSLGEYGRTLLTAVAAAPLLALRLPGVVRGMRPAEIPVRDFIGIGVTPGSAPDADLVALVRDLGVRRLLVRVPVWHRDRLVDYQRFLDRFPDCEVLIAVLQDRGSVAHPACWSADLRAILGAFVGRVRDVQIGQAINRTKWGCANLGDAFDLLEAAERLRGEFPGIRLAGPALIDFEPLAMLRSLLTLRRFRLDAVASLLYVDRRGAPTNRQYGWFDLRRKIALQAAIARLSPRLRPPDRGRLWITETNWPLAGTGEAAPTSPDECVGEDEQAVYLRAYFQQAYATGLVERVYWWQLVATGYGLVDPRGGTLRRRPAFTVLQRLLAGDIGMGRAAFGSGTFTAMRSDTRLADRGGAAARRR